MVVVLGKELARASERLACLGDTESIEGKRGRRADAPSDSRCPGKHCNESLAKSRSSARLSGAGKEPGSGSMPVMEACGVQECRGLVFAGNIDRGQLWQRIGEPRLDRGDRSRRLQGQLEEHITALRHRLQP